MERIKKSYYSIAHRDRNGYDFDGIPCSLADVSEVNLEGLPWIVGLYDDVEEVKKEAERMRSEGYKDVVPFDCTPLMGGIIYENIGWKFVEEHKVQ
jgi:hypothetical protein